MIGIAVITHEARKLLPTSLPPLIQTGYPVLVVNSSSNDGTVEYAKALGAETLVIPRSSFNHGLTRELARKKLSKEIVVFTTPDAILVDPKMLDLLTHPLIAKKAALSYARQIPHDGADFFEAFSRSFNYGEKSHIRNLSDKQAFGSYLTFASNSFSAYRNETLDAIGGFQKTLAGEDSIAAAKLLLKGESIAYVAECVVKHSHRYTLLEEFRRAFDTGFYRRQEKALFAPFGSDEKRGYSFAKALLSQRPHPYSLLYLFSRFLGYQVGKRHTLLPKALYPKLSSQGFFWI